MDAILSPVGYTPLSSPSAERSAPGCASNTDPSAFSVTEELSEAGMYSFCSEGAYEGVALLSLSPDKVAAFESIM